MKKSLKVQQNHSYIKKYKKKTNRKGWGRGLYDWLSANLKNRTIDFSTYHHRYKQVRALVIAKLKARDLVSEEELLQDVKELYERWNKASKKWRIPNIEWHECIKAIRSFDNNPYAFRYKKEFLRNLCGFDFRPPRRSRLSQDVHLRVMREVRKTYYKNGNEDVYSGGRPDKKEIILEYTKDHPESNRSQIARTLKISYRTVIKWLKTSTSKSELIIKYAKEHPKENHSQIAKALNISRPTVIKWLKTV